MALNLGGLLSGGAKILGGALGGPLGAAGVSAGLGILGGLTGGGKVKYTNPVPQDVQGLRSGLSNYLQSNMGGLQQQAAQSQGQQFSPASTSNFAPQGSMQQAQAGNSAVDYSGLQGFRPNATTGPVGFNGLGNVGNGQSGDFINRLANGNAVGSLAGNQGVNSASQRLLSPQQVGAQRVAGIAPTQSIDQLSTGFMQNMLGQYNPLFEQQRQQALAAAKEASGNLTGSGFANALGNATAQTLAQQQAQLGNLAQFGIGQETGRQQTMAGLENQRNLADAANNLQGQIANQGAGLQGAQAAGQLGLGQNDAILRALGLNQQGLTNALAGEQANLGRNQDVLSRSGELGLYGGLQNRQISSNEFQNNQQLDFNRLQQLTQLQQNNSQFNAGQNQQNSQFNAGQNNNYTQFLNQLGQNNSQFNAGQNQQNNQYYAGLGQNNNQFNAGQQNDMSNANAQRLAGLTGQMATAGVGVPQAYSQPNFLQSLGQGVAGLIPYMGPKGQGGSSPYVSNSFQMSGGAPQSGTPGNYAMNFLNGQGASQSMGTPGNYAMNFLNGQGTQGQQPDLQYAPGMANQQEQSTGLLNALQGGGQGGGTQSGLWNRPSFMNPLPNMAVDSGQSSGNSIPIWMR